MGPGATGKGETRACKSGQPTGGVAPDGEVDQPLAAGVAVDEIADVVRHAAVDRPLDAPPLGVGPRGCGHVGRPVLAAGIVVARRRGARGRWVEGTPTATIRSLVGLYHGLLPSLSVSGRLALPASVLWLRTGPSQDPGPAISTVRGPQPTFWPQICYPEVEALCVRHSRLQRWPR